MTKSVITFENKNTGEVAVGILGYINLGIFVCEILLFSTFVGIESPNELAGLGAFIAILWLLFQKNWLSSLGIVILAAFWGGVGMSIAGVGGAVVMVLLSAGINYPVIKLLDIICGHYDE